MSPCACGKFIYPNKRIANKVSKNFKAESGQRLHLYPCPYCGQIHGTTHYTRQPRRVGDRKRRVEALGGLE